MFAQAGIVEALDLRNNQLTLRTSRAFQVGERTKVRVQLPPGTGKVVSLPIEVSETAGPGLYRAQVLVDLNGAEYRGSDPALRTAPRYDVRLRVRSPELPGYQAMAIDFSPTGAQLELSGPVESGRQFELHFDLDGYRRDSIECLAQVAWCEQKQNQWQGGFRFVQTGPALQLELDHLANFLGHRANSRLEQLLEQAKILAPTPILRPQSAAQPAPKPAAPTPAAQPAPQPQAAPPTLNLPLQATLDGYTRNLNSGSLYLRLLSEDGQLHTLEFPDCQCLRDLETFRCRQLRSLASTQQSAWLEELAPRLGPGNWKHYQLLSEDSQLLMELISRPCRAG